MINISLAYPYDLASVFHRLRLALYEGRPISEAWYDLHDAENHLVGLLAPGAIYAEALKGATVNGNILYEAIKKLTTEQDRSRQLDMLDVFSVRNALDHFETVLKAELSATPAYFVSKKGGFDTIDLLVRGETLFSQKLPAKVPDAVQDIQEAGRCIAYELGTAAGFHMLRANEVVLLRYFDTVAGVENLPSNRNLGALLKKMTELKVGNEKVIATLTQIKDLHRNTLLHPEDVLTVGQAIDLLGIIRSAVSAMLEEIPDRLEAKARRKKKAK